MLRKLWRLAHRLSDWDLSPALQGKQRASFGLVIFKHQMDPIPNGFSSIQIFHTPCHHVSEQCTFTQIIELLTSPKWQRLHTKQVAHSKLPSKHQIRTTRANPKSMIHQSFHSTVSAICRDPPLQTGALPHLENYLRGDLFDHVWPRLEPVGNQGWAPGGRAFFNRLNWITAVIPKLCAFLSPETSGFPEFLPRHHWPLFWKLLRKISKMERQWGFDQK